MTSLTYVELAALLPQPFHETTSLALVGKGLRALPDMHKFDVLKKLDVSDNQIDDIGVSAAGESTL